ncbi:hypothetical protein [Staphylococcus aureus]|uniref:hypothetical protein n=1 Tax=Staphylococcus aureus TaxID=1280 RepID=UPI001CC4ADA1|nr:hypothetical protein [Staphylococcus aureus]MBZ5280797.1 hypothetical protein [Staphylococcus aureus]
MEKFIKKHIYKNSDGVNRLYLGYKNTGLKRHDFYINIHDFPSIMITGERQDILEQILTLIGINIKNRSFDSDVITEIYGEKSNVRSKYNDFENVYNNQSVESILLDLKQEVNDRLSEFEKQQAMNISQYNEQAQKPMKRRVVIIDSFEDIMDNIIVLGLYKSLTTRMRMVGITLIALVNTEKLEQSIKPPFYRNLEKIQEEMILYFPCKIMTRTNAKFEVLPYDTQQLKEKQMVIEYGKYTSDFGLLREQLSEVLQIPEVKK